MHLIDALLQNQLVSDESAVINLPSIIPLLSPALFADPSHSNKLWLARINSMLERPKHPGARWAAMTLACKTAQLSKDALISSAQNWITYALPTLSRDEPLPTLNASVHLLATIYTAVLDMPEFHRQVIAPSVQKFSLAILQLSERAESPVKLKALCMHTLTLVVHHHPSLHVALHGRLQNLTLSHLSGHFPSTSDSGLVQSAADLHAVLHLTGGKVRGTAGWRKSVDCAISSIISSLHEISMSNSGNPAAMGFELPALPTDSFQMSIPIALDRIRSLTRLLTSLLRCTTSRPVAIPIGAFASLGLRLMGASEFAADAHSNTYTDPQRKALENSVYPSVWLSGCDLVAALSECARHHLTPYVSQITHVIAHQTEKVDLCEHRTPFIRTLLVILRNSHAHPVHTPYLSTRLLKTLLPCLSRLLSHEIIPSQSQTNYADVNGDSRSAKAKKKAKMYDGDEVFRTKRDLLVQTNAEGDEILVILAVLPYLISSPHTNSQTSSVASRLLIALLLQLPQTPSLSVSHDVSLHSRIMIGVLDACEATILHGANNPWLRRGLSLFAQVMTDDSSPAQSERALRTLSLLIHPQLPPTLRSTGSLDSISLYRTEGKDERDAREGLGLISLEDTPPSTADVAVSQLPTTVMVDDIVMEQATRPLSHDAPAAEPEYLNTNRPIHPPNPVLSVVSKPADTLADTSRVPETAQKWSSFEPVTRPAQQPPRPQNPMDSHSVYGSGSDDDDDDDEPIPEIDMRSDSDE